MHHYDENNFNTNVSQERCKLGSSCREHGTKVIEAIKDQILID